MERGVTLDILNIKRKINYILSNRITYCGHHFQYLTFDRENMTLDMRMLPNYFMQNGTQMASGISSGSIHGYQGIIWMLDYLLKGSSYKDVDDFEEQNYEEWNEE